MPVSIAELKGLAVRRMNADPKIPMKGGHALTRNFVLEVERAWGFPSLRFGEHVHLLAVDNLSADLLGGGTDRQGFLIVTDSLGNPEKQKLLSQPARTIRVEGAFDDPEQAVDRASIVGAGLDFIRRAIAGEFTSKRPAPALSDEIENEEDTWKSNRIAEELDLSIFDKCDPEPPTMKSMAPLLARVRAIHSKRPETAHHWNDFSVTSGRSILETPSLRFGTSHECFVCPSVPGNLFDDGSGKPDLALHHPGIVTLSLVARKIDLDVAALLPQLPVERFSIISIRPNWGSAIFKAANEWFLRKLHNELQSKLDSNED